MPIIVSPGSLVSNGQFPLVLGDRWRVRHLATSVVYYLPKKAHLFILITATALVTGICCGVSLQAAATDPLNSLALLLHA